MTPFCPPLLILGLLELKFSSPPTPHPPTALRQPSLSFMPAPKQLRVWWRPLKRSRPTAFSQSSYSLAPPPQTNGGVPVDYHAVVFLISTVSALTEMGDPSGRSVGAGLLGTCPQLRTQGASSPVAFP